MAGVYNYANFRHVPTGLPIPILYGLGSLPARTNLLCVQWLFASIRLNCMVRSQCVPRKQYSKNMMNTLKTIFYMGSLHGFFTFYFPYLIALHSKPIFDAGIFRLLALPLW